MKELTHIPNKDNEFDLSLYLEQRRFKTETDKALDKIFKSVRPKIERIICIGPEGPIQLPKKMLNMVKDDKEKENPMVEWYLEWDNNIKGRPHGFREDSIITAEEWAKLSPKEKLQFTRLTNEEKKEYVKEMRSRQ